MARGVLLSPSSSCDPQAQEELMQLEEEDLCAAIEEFARPARMETIFESFEDEPVEPEMLSSPGVAADDRSSAVGYPSRQEKELDRESKDVGMVVMHDHGNVNVASTWSSSSTSCSSPSSASSSPRLLLQQSVLAWCEATGAVARVRVHVQGATFELHELPLVSRSGLLRRVLQSKKASGEVVEVELGGDFPGGAEAFGWAAAFCYGAHIVVEPSNVAMLRCAAEYLEMSAEMGRGSLAELCDMYLTKVALQSWEGSIGVLAADIQRLLPLADELLIVTRCVDSLASIACTQLVDDQESIAAPEWWMQQLVELPYALFARIVAATRRQGMAERVIGQLMIKCVERWIFGRGDADQQHKNRDYYLWCGSQRLEKLEQRSDKCRLLESMVRLLPVEKQQLLPVSFLFRLLRHALGVGASTECRLQIETRIACQLELASVDDLLLGLPLKDGRTSKAQLESARQIGSLFLQQQQQQQQDDRKQGGGGSHVFSSSRDETLLFFTNIEAVNTVSKIWDGYLEYLGYDPGINPVTLSDLIDVFPACARTSHDQLYKAIHVYLKSHPHVTHSERLLVCRSLNCQKLSQEACIHAVQNELMPLRTIVQAMFMEQLQSRHHSSPAPPVPPSGELPSHDTSVACSSPEPCKDIRVSSSVATTNTNGRIAAEAAPKRSSSHRFHREQFSGSTQAQPDDSSKCPSSDFPYVVDSQHNTRALYVNRDFEAAKSRLKHLEKELAQVKKTLQQNKCPGMEHLNASGPNAHKKASYSTNCIGQMLHSQRAGINFGHRLLKTFKKLGLGSLWRGKYNACYDVSNTTTTSTDVDEEEQHRSTFTSSTNEFEALPARSGTRPATPNNNLSSGQRRPCQHHRSHSVS
ncbi:BTB/POZ domain-containing protein SR1IP1 [Selaginella moellendorffii]|uniref:BTB/POZ domain-containing protein SR1IP1 n=1 Tax=Selaginella moellendorffii TaxID=88036 RepID=UPI000D1D0B6D|nr:BTB/POZ domain-containing protein SR1IP1 [Selaginella moellendorffii]|eukprot:XP_024515905.1 BTB/POZ domain-containing protein SR1IP1 [Selaginella moellendorffii]